MSPPVLHDSSEHPCPLSASTLIPLPGVYPRYPGSSDLDVSFASSSFHITMGDGGDTTTRSSKALFLRRRRIVTHMRPITAARTTVAPKTPPTIAATDIFVGA